MESEDRVVVMSSSGFSDLVQPEGGKNFHWTCDKNIELPIKIRATGVGSERPRTLPEAFYETTQAHTNYPALFVERNGKILQWTWGEYFRDSMSFAKALAKFNVSERTGVSIMGFNAPEWAIAYQGTIMFNCISNGIYITNEPEACLYQINHSDSEVIIVETNEHLKKIHQVLPQMPQIKVVVIYGEATLSSEFQDSRYILWSDFIRSGVKEFNDDYVFEKMKKQRPGHLATLIYTSGTTGNPKGCMISHDNLTWESDALLAQAWGPRPDLIGPQNRIVSYLPLSHIAGLSLDILSQVSQGYQVYFAKPDALQGTLVETLNWARPTCFLAVPRVWEKFEERLKAMAAEKPAFMQSISGWAKGYGTANTHAKMKNEDPPFMYSFANFMILSRIKSALGLDKCEMFLFGAAPMRQASIDYFASLDMPLFNLYGMSETAGAATLHSFTKFRLDAAGFCVGGTDLKIANPDVNGEGEICMRGRNTMMGYLKNEKATTETIDGQGFVRSGDKGKIEADGFLKITGRIKELIITAGGENVAPVPIEDTFKEECPPCSNIMVIGEQQRFMAALVTFKVDIDPATGNPSNNLMVETAKFFKNELGLDIKTSDEACNNPKVIEYMNQAIERTNARAVSRAAHIRKIKLLPVDFSIPGGQLTPTMKLKRKVTEKQYQEFVDEMFKMEAKL